jgi:hypothetical protein
MTVLKRFPNEGCDFGNGGGAVGWVSGMTRRFNYEYGVEAKIFQLTEKYFRLAEIVESKADAGCISMKTNRGFHDPGFQVRIPSASQVAGIHGGGSVNPCLGDRR